MSIIRKTLLKSRFMEGTPPVEDGFYSFIDSNLNLAESNQSFYQLTDISLQTQSLNGPVSASVVNLNEASYTARSVVSSARDRGGMLGKTISYLLSAASPVSATFTPLNGQKFVYRNQSGSNRFVAPNNASYKIDNLSPGASLTISNNSTKELIVFSSALLVKSL